MEQTDGPTEKNTTLTSEDFSHRIEILGKIVFNFLAIDKYVGTCGPDPTDFDEPTIWLSHIHDLASPLRADFIAYSGQGKGKACIHAAITYIDSFLASIEALQCLTSALALQATGVRYSKIEYTKDWLSIRRSEKRRKSAADKLEKVRRRGWI